MSETIYQGYVISIIDFQVFDQIVTFLNTNGEKIACCALGVRKILSKNGRHLIVGNFNEFEIFQSNSPFKISKLKKTICIKPIDWELHEYKSFALLNEFATKYLSVNFFADGFNIDLYNLYDRSIKLISSKSLPDAFLSLIIIVKIIKFLGLGFTYKKCIMCNNKLIKSIDFWKGGFICKNCFNASIHKKYSKKEIEFIYLLFSEREISVEKYTDVDFKKIKIELFKFIENIGGIRFYSEVI